MGAKPIALMMLAALGASSPSWAEDFLNPQLTSPGTMVYVSVPLGGATAKERLPSYGFALQGKRQYERLLIDNRMLGFIEGAVAGIEVKWLIVGAVVVGAGAYAMRKDEDRSDSYSGSQNNQQNNSGSNAPPPPPPPCDNPDPCKK
jgi:hypothetical protein